MTPVTMDFAAPAEPGLVSVVIPSYNRAGIVHRAIDSVLDQTYTNFEVIVADDGSADDTRAVVGKYGDRVRYLHQENGGVAAARNLGILNSRGEFVAFLDSDDAWFSWKLDAEVAVLRRHPEAVLVWTDMTSVDPSGAVIHDRHLRVMYTAHAEARIEEVMDRVDTVGALTPSAPAEVSACPVLCGDLSARILLGNLVHTSTVLFRRDLVRQVGGVDESFLNAGEDYEFHVRLCSLGKVALIDAPAGLYRMGADDQITAPKVLIKFARATLRTLERHLPGMVARKRITPDAARKRMAGSLAWVGEAELESGHPLIGARHLLRSLTLHPRFDRREMLLAMCLLPAPARRALRKGKHAVRQMLHSRKSVGVEGAT